MKRIAIMLMAGVAVAATYNYASSQPVNGTAEEWPTYGHDKGGMRFSPLTQITPANVNRLQIAWRYHMKPGNTPETAAAAARAAAAQGPLPRRDSVLGPPGGGGVGGLYGDLSIPNNARPTIPDLQLSESTPLVVNGIMYAVTPYGRVVSLDPATGKELWVHQIPFNGNTGRGRGLEYWPGDATTAPRLYYHSSIGGIVAIDAKTGALVTSFGEGGMLKSNAAIGSSNSPPIIVGNVIVSQRASPNRDGREGDVRGFDLKTGRQLWRFNSVPLPGEKNYGTWPGPDTIRSGSHMWGLLTADVARNIVYLTFNAPNNNRFGGERPGQNLYSTSMVAVNSRTGEYLWHFQLVHHDIWDADMQAPPMLFDVRRNGQTIPAVAAVNKMSLLFILNRVTGEHIYKVEERPVLKSDNPDERAYPTQPIPVEIPPLARQSITPDQIANLTPQHTAFCKKFIADNNIKLEGGPYIPAGYKYPTVQFPGTLGGPNWGGMSFNPQLGYLFINTMDLGQVQGLIPTPPGMAAGRGGRGGQQAAGGRGGAQQAGGGGAGAPAPAGRGADVDDDPASYSFMQPFGRFKEANSNMMCNAPPWGRLIAVDVNTGKFAWEVPLGVTDDLPPALQKTGRPNLGGSIATASGLVFIGATDDRRFRAFDARNGRELWTVTMPAVAQSVPITYRAKNGKQYVVVTATGGGFLQMPIESDTITAFALPN